ncbi:hypothetical protein [Streptomyces variegatus]|uniref:hypothetical protein n=1 Tax=Streptomyces variegatus TaxID=284040 RepID=UPI003C2D27E5
MTDHLPSGEGFNRFTVLDLDRTGNFVFPDSVTPVPQDEVSDFLRGQLIVPKNVTDIFVWVHGWQHVRESAYKTAARLFAAIESLYTEQSKMYQHLEGFRAMYVAIRWPSKSAHSPRGYFRIRNRAHGMTTHGYAEFALSHLLGYLDEERERPKRGPDTLMAASGQYLHCIGHSFGGRFLAEAIAAAPAPQPPTLRLLHRNERFEYTIDNLVVFQMAARRTVFADQFKDLLDTGPLQGPVCLTFSRADRANCSWHRFTESGACAVGCRGATKPSDRVRTTLLRSSNDTYKEYELSYPIVNIDASWLYRKGRFTRPEGAHSDFWYRESIHLILTLVDYARPLNETDG